MRGALAAVCVLVAIGGIIFLSAGGNSATTPSQPTNNNGKPIVVKPAKIVLECEEPTTLEDKTKDGTMKIITKVERNEGAPIAFLEIKSGFIDECQLGVEKTHAGKLPGRATYDFEAPRKDTYYLHLRAKWRDNCGNAVWVAMDKANAEEDWIDLSDQLGKIGEKNFTWWWHTLKVGGLPRGFELDAGKHTLLMNVQKDGPQLDQWVISTDPQAPVGQDPVKK